MKASLSHVLDPLAHFTALYRELARQTPWWADNGWLRFAAQAAVLRPANAADTAQRIKETAATLGEGAHWYETLSSPWGLVTAATLVQQGDSVASFTEAMAAAKTLLRAEGFHLQGPSLIKTILALRILWEGKPITPVMLARIHRIYGQMRDHHWWLTDKEDVPCCALLAHLPGSPEEIAGVCEGVYTILRSQGFPPGNHLQTAANLLPLNGRSATEVAGRFSELCAIVRRGMPLWNEHYDALALLGLLDHDAHRIASRLEATCVALDALEPAQLAAVNFNVAADLVFLDLVRFDARLRPLIDPDDRDRIDGLIRMQRAAALILVQVPTPVVMTDGTSWPLSPGI